MIIIILSNILALSLLLNVILGALLYKAKKLQTAKKPDANAQEVLSELLQGPAVFRIECIDAGSIIQWRGKD